MEFQDPDMQQAYFNNRNDQNLSKQKSKNYEAFEQGALIYLIAREGNTVRIKKPKKAAEKTFQVHPVYEIIMRDGKTVRFAEDVEKEADDLLENDNTDQRSRRLERNKISLSFNHLVEIAEKLGYEFVEKNTRKSNLTVRMKKITGIRMNGEEIYDHAAIERIGKCVDNYIVSHFDDGFCTCNNKFIENVDNSMNSSSSQSNDAQTNYEEGMNAYKNHIKNMKCFNANDIKPKVSFFQSSHLPESGRSIKHEFSQSMDCDCDCDFICDQTCCQMNGVSEMSSDCSNDMFYGNNMMVFADDRGNYYISNNPYENNIRVNTFNGLQWGMEQEESQMGGESFINSTTHPYLYPN